MNNNLRRFDRFSGQAKFAVPNHLRHAGYDRLTRATLPWQGATAISKPKEKTNIDQLWATVERNIANEQAIKAMQQEAVNRETVRMIKELEEYDKARKLRRDVSDETEIQGMVDASHQANEPTDSYESRTMVDDSGLYAANAQPYVQGGVRLGTWSGGNPSQYATFASAYSEPKIDGNELFWQSSVDDNEKMNMKYPTYADSIATVTPLGLGRSSIFVMNGRDRVRALSAGLGIYDYDPVFAHEVDEALRTDERARAIWEEAKGVFGDVLLDQIFNIIMLWLPSALKTPIYVYMLLYGICQCAQTLREKAVKEYQEEHHCSEDEARRNVRYDKELLVKIYQLFMDKGLDRILGK